MNNCPTLHDKVAADEGSINVLQEDDALFRGHGEQVVEPVV